ncbi:hypothetical protein LB533_15130 [Mesorhizobium sp. BR1-1-13]|uniref:hypothetical protein n=1 Tax=Mesorhizobium sp. BR1-1-13 TaxID=2876656 RepID=UPI001CD0CE00|nr:hypothetical protein [Mesorhizobium sp. BR1-1-13]MBZ9942427.1 hypothetical protein [Mesorhizobium sp. BR1-1-13]
MADPNVWVTLLTVGATAFGTLAVTYFGSWLALGRETKLKKEDRDRHAAYLAVRIVAVLDPFVYACCDVVADKGSSDAEGYRHSDVNAPELAFPADVNWKSIDSGLMYRILTLPNEIASARQSMGFVGQHIACPPDYEEWYEERAFQFGTLGIAALDLATELRGKFGIPMRDYSRYDPRPVLERAFAEREKMLKQSAANTKRIIAAARKKKAKGSA